MLNIKIEQQIVSWPFLDYAMFNILICFKCIHNEWWNVLYICTTKVTEYWFFSTFVFV